MATALRTSLLIQSGSVAVSAQVPLARSSRRVFIPKAWHKSWQTASWLNGAGNQQPPWNKRRNIAVSACTSDIRYAIQSADHSEAEVLIGVEACGDGSLLFKYGVLGENTGAAPEDTQAKGLEAAELPADDTGTVNWAFANGAAAAEHHTQGGEPPPEQEVQNGRLASGEGVVEAAASVEETDGGFVATGPMADGDVCEETTISLESEESEPRCPLRLETGVAVLPHPAKAERGGEDAHFMEGNWVGVADGVSSWAELGINSGLYSRELMWNCLEIIRNGEAGMDPKLVIEESHGRTDLQGSCTAVVAVLDGQTLRVANLGDSGFAVVRAGRMLVRSQPMQHSFNVPFQVGTSGGDDPSVAEEYRVELQARDIVLLGSDGLFDNVFEDVIAGTLTQAVCEGKGPEVAAKQLALFAQKQSNQTTGSSPFRESAQAAGQQYDGGKKDDITVLVAYVS